MPFRSVVSSGVLPRHATHASGTLASAGQRALPATIITWREPPDALRLPAAAAQLLGCAACSRTMTASISSMTLMGRLASCARRAGGGGERTRDVVQRAEAVVMAHRAAIRRAMLTKPWRPARRSFRRWSSSGNEARVMGMKTHRGCWLRALLAAALTVAACGAGNAPRRTPVDGGDTYEATAGARQHNCRLRSSRLFKPVIPEPNALAGARQSFNQGRDLQHRGA
jgi:hypothetical protein